MSVRKSQSNKSSKKSTKKTVKRVHTPSRFSRELVIRTLIGNMANEQEKMKRLAVEIDEMEKMGDDPTFEVSDRNQAEHRFYAFKSIANQLNLSSTTLYKKYYDRDITDEN